MYYFYYKGAFTFANSRLVKDKDNAPIVLVKQCWMKIMEIINQSNKKNWD